MNDPVKTLMKQSISTARKFRSLDRQLTKLLISASAQIGMILRGNSLKIKKRLSARKCARCPPACRAWVEGEKMNGAMRRPSNWTPDEDRRFARISGGRKVVGAYLREPEAICQICSRSYTEAKGEGMKASSALACNVMGMARPSALAALRLMVSSILVDCTTGRSAGRSPLSSRPA
jgi:hypothetical protein